jgi:hypothetical protein
MKRLILALAISSFAATGAFAQSCELNAVSVTTGKLLTGAAKASYIKKCKHDTCVAKAYDQDGKPLAGAAKASFLKKCEANA